MVDEKDAGPVTHSDIRSAIRWHSLAIAGLAAVGSFLLLNMRTDAQEFKKDVEKTIANVEKTVDGLSSTLRETNSVLRDTSTKLEGVGKVIEMMDDRGSDALRRHEEAHARERELRERRGRVE